MPSLHVVSPPALSHSSSSVQRKPTSASNTTDPTSSRSAPNSWIEHAPKELRPYLYLARADKQIGTLLLFYPSAWSIMMASYALNLPISAPLTYLTVCMIGSFLMRAAGCVVNDMWDRNLDKGVERTKTRPIANGDVTIPQAFGFLGLQLSAALAIATQFNWYSILFGISSFPIVIVYPLMKRITYWPQSVLGLAFNWGALVGWSTVTGSVNWSVCLPLYAGGIAWTLVYDTIYAHQDKRDDVKMGIRSTALLFKGHTRLVLSVLSVATVVLVGWSGYMVDTQLIGTVGVPFYLGLAIGALQLLRVLVRTNFEDRVSCWDGFVGCGWFGFWVWMGAAGNYFYLAN